MNVDGEAGHETSSNQVLSRFDKKMTKLFAKFAFTTIIAQRNVGAIAVSLRRHHRVTFENDEKTTRLVRVATRDIVVDLRLFISRYTRSVRKGGRSPSVNSQAELQRLPFPAP